MPPPNLEEIAKKAKLIKRETKKLGTLGYTPLTARMLAQVLTWLVDRPGHVREEHLSAFRRVAEGRAH